MTQQLLVYLGTLLVGLIAIPFAIHFDRKNKELREKRRQEKKCHKDLNAHC